MYLVVRRGAFETLAAGGELAGAAAVACLREFDVPEEWRARPGKVTLRARTGGQWAGVLEEPHALAGDAVAALPPRRRSERGPLLSKLQAMSTALEPPPPERRDDRWALTYALNPHVQMSSGKALAQIAHAAVMAAAELPEWARAGCPARVILPPPAVFDALDPCVEVVDGGLTELPPGTVTVRALAP
jgi:hypothetical protein